MLKRYLLPAAVLAVSSPVGTLAAEPEHSKAEADAFGLAMKSMLLRSVQGLGNETGKVALLYKQRLISYGFSEQDIEITSYEDTAYRSRGGLEAIQNSNRS